MVIFAILLLCLTSTFAVPPTVDFFAGRSADIVIQSASSSVQDSIIFFKGDQFSTTQLNGIEDTRFADLFAHVMGTQPFYIHADRSGFPESSLFNKPKAAVVVVIESVGADTLNKYPTLSLFQNAHAAALTTQSSPANTHSLLANLATGTSPSTHGIVGASWRKPVTGMLVTAYDANGLPFSANVADILLQETHGHSLVVSASASASFASALAAHPELVSENLGWRAHAYSLSEEGAFASRYEEPSCDQVLALSAEELAALLADVTVTVGNVDVTFSAKNPADLALLSELTFVSHLIAKLRSDSVLSALVKDNTPDMYSFVFSSLKGIQTHYGIQSDEFSAALTLVDKATDSFVSALNELYDNRVASAIVALNAHDTSSEALKQRVYNKVARLLYDEEDFAEYYPTVYVRTNDFVGYARDLICSNLQEDVSKDARVLCISPFLPTRGLRATANDSNDSSDNPWEKQDTDTVWAFWLNFWVTIVIFAFVMWGVYNLAYVGGDASKDSLLFRATGRHQHQQ